MKQLFVFFMLMATLGLASCFHKSDTKGMADNVEDMILYEGADGQCVVVKESVFHVTSKKRGGGINVTTGHSTIRLSSYDLKTGKQLARVVIGDMNKENLNILGLTGNRLWCVAMDKEQGLHTRNPLTLELLENQSQLAARIPALKNAIREFKFYEIDKYFGFNHEEGAVVFTDISGNRQQIDPATGATTIREKPTRSRKFARRPLLSSTLLGAGEQVNLRGELKKNLSRSYKEDGNLYFLKGEIMAGTSPESHVLTYNFFAQFFTANEAELKKDFRFRDMMGGVRNHSELPITDEKLKALYILHQNTLIDSARPMISRVEADSGNQFSIRWSATLNSIFREPDKAVKMGMFEELFAKGDPKLNTMLIDHNKTHILFLFNLRLICIEKENGQVIWDRPLE